MPTPPGWSELRHAERPVAFFLNGIGDALLALPALRALAEIFAGRLTLICDPRDRRLFYHELPVRRIVDIPDRVQCTFPVSALAAAVGPTDLFLYLISWRSRSLTALIRALSAGTVAGFLREHDLHVQRPRRLHAADLFFLFPQHIDPSKSFADYAAPPRLPEAAMRAASALRRALPAGARVLVVHPDTSPPKCWSVERFRALLDGLLARRPDLVVWVVGLPYGPLDDGPRAGRVVSYAGLPLDLSMSLVSQADVFVGVDSCMLHAADMFRVPGVGLFGATRSAEWGFRVGPHRHVQGAGSLQAITVDVVADAVEQLLGALG